MKKIFKRFVSVMSVVMTAVMMCNTTSIIAADVTDNVNVSEVLISDSDSVANPGEIAFKSNKEKLKSGDTRQLELICHPGDRPVSMNFESSNNKIASVDEYGNISAKKKGSAVITVTSVFRPEGAGTETDASAIIADPSSDMSGYITTGASIKVKVEAVYKTISVSSKKLKLETRSSQNIKIKYHSDNQYAVNPKVKFTSKNPKIATVTRKGVVTGVAKGTTHIIVTAKDNQRISVKVRVNNPSMAKTIYLTFDDGPGNSTTPRLLDVLEKYNAQATFFVVGQYASGRRNIVKRAYKDGNTIAVHTYTHDYRKIYASADAYMSDLHQTANLIKDITGEYPRYFRFPGGGNNHYSNAALRAAVLKQAHQEGFMAMDWDAATNDAMGISYSADQMANFGISTINSCIKNGKIPVVLIHDSDAKSHTPYEVEQIIKYFSAKGYQFRGLNDYYGSEICFSF